MIFYQAAGKHASCINPNCPLSLSPHPKVPPFRKTGWQKVMRSNGTWDPKWKMSPLGVSFRLPSPEPLGGWCVYMDSLFCKFLEMFLGNDRGELTQQIFMRIDHEADMILAPSGLLEPEPGDSYGDVHLCPVLRKATEKCPRRAGDAKCCDENWQGRGVGPRVCSVRRNAVEKLMLQQRSEWGASLRKTLSRALPSKYNASHISSAKLPSGQL